MAAPAAPNPNRRALIVLGGFLAFIALFVLVLRPMLLGSDDDGDGDITSPVTLPGSGGPDPTVSPGPTTTTPTGEEEPVDETFETFSTKNPFQPLVDSDDGGTPGPGTTAPPSPGGTTPPTTVPRTTTTSPGATPTTRSGSTGTTSPGPATTSTTVASNEPRPAARVALVEIFEEGGQRKADVRVNDTVHENLVVGAEFAGNYQVVALEVQCGTFLFGDDRFRLCVGEEVLK